MAVALPCFTQDMEWSLNASLFGIPEDNGIEGGPMPLLPMPGIALVYSMNSFLAVGGSLDMYSTYYGYSDTLHRAVPVELEHRSSLVVGTILSPLVTYTMNIPIGIRLRFLGGFSIDARLCLIANDLTEGDLADASLETKQVAEYFWAQGRWFFPMTGFGLDFLTVSRVRIGTDFRVWYPLYRVWSGDQAPAVEGWRFALGLRFTMLSKP
ncbi:MAG: hypothetical protein SNJ56_06635 [Termitinemataceae bacterium]